MQTRLIVGRRVSSTQRQKIVERYRRSGLSQREFAARAGIGLSTLQLWLRKAQVDACAERGKFVEIPNVLVKSPATAAYRLHLAGGTILEIGSGFRSEELASLLQLLWAR